MAATRYVVTETRIEQINRVAKHRLALIGGANRLTISAGEREDVCRMLKEDFAQLVRELSASDTVNYRKDAMNTLAMILMELT